MSRRGEEGLDVADRHRGAEPDDRARRAARLQRGVGLGLERVRRRGQGAAATRASAVAPGRRASRGRGRRHASPARRPARRTRRPGSAASRVLGAPGGVVPGSVGVEHHLWHARQPGPQRLRGGRVAHAQHQVGRVRRREALVAQQHVVVGDHVRAVVLAAAHAGGGLGQHRPAGWRPRAGPRARPRPRRAGPQTIAPRGARGDPLGQRLHVVGVGGARSARGPPVHGAPSSRPCPVARVQLLGHRRQRLAQRQVQVHRARVARRRRWSRPGRPSARVGAAVSRAGLVRCRPPRTTWPPSRRA